MSRVIGYVLECKESDGSTWLDFSEDPVSPGWKPVVLAEDTGEGLLPRMRSVLRVGDGWQARADGTALWGSGPTPEDAMRAAVALLEDLGECELW